MADDPTPALRVELMTAQAVLAPQVRGLVDFAEISSSPAATQIIVDELGVRQRRLDRINAVIAALDNVVAQLEALYADGYPNFAPVIGVQTVIKEIQGEDVDLQSAANIFKSGPIRIGLDITNVIHRPQPIPTR